MSTPCEDDRRALPEGESLPANSGAVVSVPGIAFTPTQGLARGMAVEDTGGPLKAPVGKGVLPRIFDVFGNTIDRKAALSYVQWGSVHRIPPPLARRSTKSEIFETGIKVIDVLVPLERSGKAQRAAYQAVAGDLKLAYAQFEELETFARFGARQDQDTRKIIEHGRRIRACLKQPESAPASVPAQIAVLLALTAELFDPVALDQLTDAEHAVQEAAAKIPTEVCARFETAKKLSDADRKVIIELAHQALAPYEPQPEAKHEGKDGTKSERKPHESMPAARPRTGQMADSEPELKIDPTPALTNAGKPDGKPTTKATPEHST